ncbi:MAG: helix-turn-helix domain-containing protein [Candidatus Omnitrophica bacterium]|nr:helix-turn-helix domain-containing protein [Candidatus Omnitrophota bacterium]
MSDQFISVREAGQLLGVSEKKIMELSDEEKLKVYRIAGQFIRFKKSDVLAIKNAGSIIAENTHYEYTPTERIQDFFYFNDFYLISIGVVFFFLYIIFRNS